MTIELELPPELESQLQQFAKRAGQDVNCLVRDIVRERLQTIHPNAVGATELSDAEWSARLQAWADSFPPISHFVDDSRESIYEDRG